jgi:predicted DNA-binding protein
VPEKNKNNPTKKQNRKEYSTIKINSDVYKRVKALSDKYDKLGLAVLVETLIEIGMNEVEKDKSVLINRVFPD